MMLNRAILDTDSCNNLSALTVYLWLNTFTEKFSEHMEMCSKKRRPKMFPRYSIADRTTVRNGLPRKFARRQLLQQLSVTLWRYNAKIILRQYSLTAEDEFPDFDIG